RRAGRFPRARQGHAEERAAGAGVGDLDASPVALDELPGDREPEPGSPEAPGDAVVAPAEALEERLAARSGNPRTVVLDLANARVAGDARPDAHVSAVGHELHRVREEIQHDALELRGVADEDERVRRHDRQLDPSLPRHRLEERGRSPDELD